MADNPALLEILADDDDFPTDVEAWCRTTEAKLEALSKDAGAHRAIIALNGARPDSIRPKSVPPPVPRDISRILETPPARVEEIAQPRRIDLKGLRAPHPILRLSQALASYPGEKVVVRCDDPSFMTDVVVWASSTRVHVSRLQQASGAVVADLQFPGRRLEAPRSVEPVLPAAHTPVAAPSNQATLLVLHNDFESLLAAMMVANASRAQEMDVVIYFSFWGVNLLRGDHARTDVAREPVSLLQRLMKWMMPKGPKRQKMGQMHMGGMGRGLLEHFMRKNNVMSLEELIESAVESDIRFLVCTMSMGIMGIQKRDLMDLPNLEFGGVTAFVENARDSQMSMVF